MLAADGDLKSVWRTQYIGKTPEYSHSLTINLDSPRDIDGLLYVPVPDGGNGWVKDFEVRVSDDGQKWSEPLVKSSFEGGAGFHFLSFPERATRYLQLRGLNERNGLPVMSAAEVIIKLSSGTKSHLNSEKRE